MNKIYLKTLGCPKNQVDSEHLRRLLSSQGFVFIDEVNDSDIILLNTCGFIKDAKEESIEEILRLAEIKNDSGIQGNKGPKRLLVFGCLAKRYRDELRKEIPEIDEIFGVGEEKEISEYCKTVIGNKNIVIKRNNHQTSPSSYAYIKIAEGCDKKCTFCIIPSIRGRYRSIKPDLILKEALDYIKNGVKEIILVAQDITSYGKDLNGYNLPTLLRDLASIDGDFYIRLLYLYPTDITDELIHVIAEEEKIQKYVDIPLQHSEDKILRLMGRRGTKKEYTKLIRKLRRNIPGIAIRTSFIVGFPGETEEDFNGLIDFIEEIRFDRLGVFTYSKEEGTSASRLKGHIAEKVKKRRFDEIMKRQSLISFEKNRELIGRRFKAIVDEVEGDIIIARLYSHAPEIDGVVIIYKKDKLYNELDSTYSVKIGDFINVEIEDAFDYDLKGRLVK